MTPSDQEARLAEIREKQIDVVKSHVKACGDAWEPFIEDSIGVTYGGYRSHEDHCTKCKPLVATLEALREARAHIQILGDAGLKAQQAHAQVLDLLAERDRQLDKALAGRVDFAKAYNRVEIEGLRQQVADRDQRANDILIENQRLQREIDTERQAHRGTVELLSEATALSEKQAQEIARLQRNFRALDKLYAEKLDQHAEKVRKMREAVLSQKSGERFPDIIWDKCLNIIDSHFSPTVEPSGEAGAMGAPLSESGPADVGGGSKEQSK